MLPEASPPSWACWLGVFLPLSAGCDDDPKTKDSHVQDSGAADSAWESGDTTSVETWDSAIANANRFRCGSREVGAAPWGMMPVEEAELTITYEIWGYGGAAAADTDGDGCVELGLGVSEEAAYYDDEGDIHNKLGIGIMPGNTSGQVVFEEEARAFVHGEWDHWTSYVASGDLDGDGARTDWLIGAWNWSDKDFPGAVYWFPDLSQGEYEESDAAVTIWGDEDHFVYQMSAGDTDGDGFGDVHISYPVSKNLESGELMGTKVALIRGPLTEDMIASEADAIIEGVEDDNNGFGISALDAETDVDGDGTSDLVIGSPGYRSSAGRVCIFFGPVEGHLTSDDADAFLEEQVPNSVAGSALSCGRDVDGDGSDDLLVGADEFSGGIGRAYLVLGPLQGTQSLWDAAAFFESYQAYADVGQAVSINQDLDGDGHADPVIGVPGYETDESARNGAALIYYGPVEGTWLGNQADATVYVDHDKDNFGYIGSMLCGVGDTDGDGFDDLLIGATGTTRGTLIRGGLR